jgi:hypothetical protein
MIQYLWWGKMQATAPKFNNGRLQVHVKRNSRGKTFYVSCMKTYFLCNFTRKYVHKHEQCNPKEMSPTVIQKTLRCTKKIFQPCYTEGSTDAV